MVDYPVTFTGTAVAEAGEEVWTAAGEQGEPIAVSGAEAFGGSEQGVSPEELFALSIANCLVSTFRAVADRKDLAHEAVTADVEATLDRAGDEGRPEITRAALSIAVEGVDDADLAGEVAEITDRTCFVSRSVTTEVATDWTFD